MAKKPQRRRDAQQAAPLFDDSGYEDVRYAATFDYDELALSRAAELLGGERAKNALTAVNFGILAAIVLLLVIDQRNVVPAVIGVVAFVVVSTLSNKWGRAQLAYARRSTLALAVPSEKRHVVVCADAVHTRSESGTTATYPLSELRVVRSNGDCLVAGFGQRRYVYVPRRALSEQRFRDLVSFLRAQRSK